MIRAYSGSKEFRLEYMTFSGGERHVKIKGFREGKDTIPLENIVWEGVSNRTLCIDVFADRSDILIDLLLTVDAFNRLWRGKGASLKKHLRLPYVPFARQDRVMVSGEPLSSTVIGALINQCDFDLVTISDPHSDVAPSHIKNVSIVEQHELALQLLGEGFFENSIIVAPDAGAMKKCTKLAEILGHTQIGVSMKHRNLSTGAITGTSYSGPQVGGQRVIMIDDICDGGRTFIELAKVLKAQGASEVILYVTHGIFSQGADVFEGHLDEVYSAYPWIKNLGNKNTKNIFVNVDRQTNFI